ncbi:LysM peptidoglycan-binding domain-containing protein [Psychroflexus sp. ALD_RP9]|uniref:LysM peptidoglycan-binding domain-containing protein n=1 Tax=Psychroflexus sp. ALD_RP9 TaxID=2777186 RepID=UPI001A8F128E|nr:LysM domain-containing protein [Psychroflexus sp. ALD_RP9]QSS97630.1 LysM peptidoglycan-binding domain-containing protein [Psychroflexus sp. ALD_RP9]
MKKIILTVLFFVFPLVLFSQNFTTYNVESEEDLEKIAQKFEVETTDILNYNPDVSRYTNLKGKTLVIPLLKSSEQVKKFKSYNVSPKETLYSIAKQFQVEVETIIRYNSFLKSRTLDVNDVLQIPILKQPTNSENQSIKNSTFSSLKHLVQPKETKYGIAKTYGITVEKLEQLNPDKDVLQPGDYVVIKREIEQNSVTQTPNDLSYVKVQTEDDVNLLKKQFKLSEEVLKQLNPAYQYGNFSSDFVLKIPKKNVTVDKRINLVEYIKKAQPQRIALTLPFNLHKFAYDSIKKPKALLEERITRISLDLFEGARAAVDSAKKIGVFVNLEAFDTAMSQDTLNEILEKNNFSSFDAVVGPVLANNIEIMVNELRQDSVPLVLPITNSPINTKQVFNSVPLDRFKEELIITYINQNMNDSIKLSFLSDSLNLNFKQKFSYSFPEAAHVEMTESYLQFEELKQVIKQDKINWFVLDTKDLGIAEATVNYLEALRKEGFKVKLIMPSNTVLADEISNFYLARLDYLYATTSFDVSNYNLDSSNEAYHSKYFLRGFDVMLDVILRIASTDNFIETTELDGFTEYFQNKFQYEYDAFENVNYNTAAYLIEYQKDLTLKVIQLSDD